MSLRLTAATAALLVLGLSSGATQAQAQSQSMPDMPDMDMPPQALPSSRIPSPQMPDMTKDEAMGDMSPPEHGWMIMTHGRLSAVSDSQSGPRGGDKAFIEGMVMIMASHGFDPHNSIELTAMLSPDAFMGKSGYPLLLQTGETADGVHPLVDRQHPHDLFMGLTATLTHRFEGDAKAFFSAGYPGEFTFGPTAFMHRASGEDFPTAPISHHWLDSGHITMGVLTAGVAKGPFQLEVSQFTGREPDPYRFNLDPIRLDSTAIRLSWNPVPGLKAQASWARQVSPEALEPLVTLDKRSMSVEYQEGPLSSTLAYGWRRGEHGLAAATDAWLFENRWRFNAKWEGLGRFERVYNDELAPGLYHVAKVEIGGQRHFALGHSSDLALGVVRQFNTVPSALKPAYGDHPDGVVAFMTLSFHTMNM
jgi:hypothetical protein